MGFMDRLAENPSGSGGIYGMPGRENDEDALSLVNRMRDRDMQDYKDKANFNSDLSLRQERRMRDLFNPGIYNTNIQDMPHTPPTNSLSPDQQIDFQQRMHQPELDVEKQKIQSQNRFGQQALDIKSAQERLNETKNAQVNQDRDAERDRKLNEANTKIALAQQTLDRKDQNADEALKAHKEMAAAMEERHKLELENRQHEFNTRFDETKRQHEAQIKEMEEKLKQGANTETTTEVSPDGSKKTINTKRGDAATKIQVQGKDGKTYTIPKDKVDDKDADGTPHWKVIGG